MEMEKGRTSVRRGVSWSPGGLRKPFQLTQDTNTPETDYNASWEQSGINKEHMSHKTSKCCFMWDFQSLFGGFLCFSVILQHGDVAVNTFPELFFAIPLYCISLMQERRQPRKT